MGVYPDLNFFLPHSGFVQPSIHPWQSHSSSHATHQGIHPVVSIPKEASLPLGNHPETARFSSHLRSESSGPSALCTFTAASTTIFPISFSVTMVPLTLRLGVFARDILVTVIRLGSTQQLTSLASTPSLREPSPTHLNLQNPTNQDPKNRIRYK